MPYLLKADMQALFGDAELIQLTDRVNADAINDAVLDVAIAYAEDLIDAIVPKTIRPDKTKLITNLAADIARWRLYDDVAPEHVQKRYDEAMRLLRDAAAGRASLGVSETTGEEKSATGGVKSTAPGRVFNDSSLAGY